MRNPSIINSKIKTYWRNLLYRKKTHFLLNFVTLHISDSEIKQQYAIALGQHFNRIFPACMLLAIAYFLRHVIAKLTSPQMNLYELMSATLILAFALCWGFFTWKFPIYAPKLVFLYALT